MELLIVFNCPGRIGSPSTQQNSVIDEIFPLRYGVILGGTSVELNASRLWSSRIKPKFPRHNSRLELKLARVFSALNRRIACGGRERLIPGSA